MDIANHSRVAEKLMPGSVARSIARNFALALISYFVALQFVYPRFVAPLAAVHSDMYIAPDLAAAGYTLLDVAGWPRPVMWMTLLVAGHFGFEGTAVICTTITIFALVLALVLIERYIINKDVPWWMTIATFVYAMSAPSFYFDAAYDIASALALVLGLLAIFAWESRRSNSIALASSGLLFLLSLLAKESFAPAMIVYVFASARRIGKLPITIAFLAMPFLAVGLSIVDSHFAGATFVHFGAPSSDPYFIDFGVSSLLASVAYYVPPLLTPTNILLVLACLGICWINGRISAGLAVLAAALALYLPYLILPNHRLGYYYWVPVPLLMLLIPLAFTRVASNSTALMPVNVRPFANAAITALAVLAALQFGAADAAQGQWSLQQQSINRALMSDLRERAQLLRSARSVLVCGVSFPFHPWAHPRFLSTDLGFRGTWTIATEPETAPIGAQSTARPISYAHVRWADYDLIIIVEPDGHIAAALRPQQLNSLERHVAAPVSSPAQLIAEIRKPGAVHDQAVALETPTLNR